MFRILKDPDYLETADTVHEVRESLTDVPPGRYAIEEVTAAGDLLRSAHSCRRWGIATRDADGEVTLDPDPWPT